MYLCERISILTLEKQGIIYKIKGSNVNQKYLFSLSDVGNQILKLKLKSLRELVAIN